MIITQRLQTQFTQLSGVCLSPILALQTLTCASSVDPCKLSRFCPLTTTIFKESIPRIFPQKMLTFSPAFPHPFSLPEHKYKGILCIQLSSLKFHGDFSRPFLLFTALGPHSIPLTPCGNQILSNPSKSPRVSTPFLQHTLERF